MSEFDIHQFMAGLATQRPLYHNEADFQHDFAWNFHQQYGTFSVRLEYPIRLEHGKMRYLDLWFYEPTRKLAVELKYKTRFLEIDHNGEHFHLKDHSAQDGGRYDFLKDVMRLEWLKERTTNMQGYAVLLTNEPLYWTVSRLETMDRNFRLHESSRLVGELNWHRNPGDGTTEDRTEPIHLAREYMAEWKLFSKLSTSKGGEFRYLVFTI